MLYTEDQIKKYLGILGDYSIVKKNLDFDDYVQCLYSIYSKEVNKVALSNEDDKRKVLLGKVKTIALR